MATYIVNTDEAGNMMDKNGNLVGLTLSSYDLEEYVEKAGVDVVKLVGLGVSPDDLIKMKASGLL